MPRRSKPFKKERVLGFIRWSASRSHRSSDVVTSNAGATIAAAIVVVFLAQYRIPSLAATSNRPNVPAALVESSCRAEHSIVVSPANVQRFLAVVSLAADDPFASRLRSLAGRLTDSYHARTDSSEAVGIWLPAGFEAVPSFESGAR